MRDYYYGNRGKYPRPKVLEDTLKEVKKGLKEESLENKEREKEQLLEGEISLGEVEVKEIPAFKPHSKQTGGVRSQEQNAAGDMMLNMEQFVGRLRYMADSMENMVNTAHLMGYMLEMTRKGTPMTMESIPMLMEMMRKKGQSYEAGPQYNESSYQYQEKAEKAEEEKSNSSKKPGEKKSGDKIDVNEVVNKLMVENPEMANNPMAKMLLQMINSQKKV